MTSRTALPLLLFATTCLFAPACALGTSDTVDGTGDPGDAASAHDAASPDTGSPGFGHPDGAADSPTEAGEDLDAPPFDAFQGDETAPPVDADVDAGIDSGARDAGSDTGSVCVAHGFSGTLVTFDLASEPGDEATAPVTSTATGVSSSALGRAAAISAVSGSGSINGSNWGTGTSADPTRYYTLTVTPAAGCTIDVTSLTYDVKASGTGPSKGDIATSVDSFGTHSASFAGTSTGKATLSATSSGALEIRVFGFGATSSSGTFRVQNTLTLGGSLQ